MATRIARIGPSWRSLTGAERKRVAGMLAVIQIVGLLSTELHVHGRLGDYLASFDLNTAGFVIVGLFVVVWVLALSIWRFVHVAARWEPGAARSRAGLATEEAL